MESISPNRRQFLAASASAGVAAIGAPRRSRGRRSALDLLILGGTGFIGPHLVRHAVARGHRVSIFTRGRHDAALPDGVTRLVGDRNGQLGALEGRRWDAVIDDSATNPEWVRLSTEMLRDTAGQYLFTSSTGVYYPYLRRGVDEETPVLAEAAHPADLSEDYGVKKARCENQTRAVFGSRAIVVRPTYIVGPGDTTDRFPYWPVRLAQGGPTLAPGRRDDPSQVIDVRDLVAFMVRLVENRQGGTFNAAGPATTLTFGRFLETARRAIRSTATFTWIEDYDFLTRQEITESIPWVMLAGNDLGHMSVRNERARAAGLRFRPLADTVRDTLAWWPTVPETRRNAPKFSITPEIERRALAAWKTRTPS